jgi:site-specific recombinase XerD
MSARDFPALLQAFFTERLLEQRRASAHTVLAYRNTFRLLLRFAAERLGRAPSRLVLADLDAAFQQVPRAPRARPRQLRP